MVCQESCRYVATSFLTGGYGKACTGTVLAVFAAARACCSRLGASRDSFGGLWEVSRAPSGCQGPVGKALKWKL